MQELTGSPIVDIRRVPNTNRIANYVAKYVGKEPHKFIRCKRYWSTRDYVTVERDPDTDDVGTNSRWEIVDYALELWTQGMAMQGYVIEGRAGRTVIELRAPP